MNENRTDQALKLLVDAVQSSRFITKKKSDALIRKIESLTSRYEASKLDRQVYVAERVKTDNEVIYYTVDLIHQAVNSNCSVEFQYYNWRWISRKSSGMREPFTG